MQIIIPIQLPFISVIVTAYNYAHTLSSTLESLIAQDYPSFEILILDNASTDQTPEVIAQYMHDPRVRAFRHETNIGMIPNHNFGIREAHGSYTMFLAADNLMLPGALTRAQAVLAKNPEVELVYSGIFLMSPSGRIIRRRDNELQTSYVGGRDELPILLGYGCDMQIEATLVSKNLWRKYGYLDECLIAADYEILLRWSANHVKVAYVPDPFIAYRIHQNQQSSVKNYVENGTELAEYVSLVDTYVQPQYADRFHGFEHALSQNLSRKFEVAVHHNPVAKSTFGSLVSQCRERISEILRRNVIMPFVPRISIIVLATTSLYALEYSLRSLLDQTEPDWEAIIVQQPGISLEPFCQLIGATKFRVASLIEHMSESAALNTGILLGSGNCFTFLRAGSAFPSNHLKMLKEALAHDDKKLLGTKCNLTITSETLEHFISTEAFSPLTSINDLLIAPALPLECIAFRRELIDEYQSFNIDFPSLAYWELIARLAHQHPLTILSSTVHLNSILNFTDPAISEPTLFQSTQRLYELYPSPNEHVSQLRQAYLTGLALLADNQDFSTPSPVTRLFQYQCLSGYSILKQNPVAQDTGAAA